MNNLKKLAITAGIIVVAGAAYYGIGALNQPQYEEPATQQTETAQSVEQITFADSGATVRYIGEDDKTALETLKGLTVVETDTGSFGEFVTTINGKAAGESQYWSFYVDGKYASEGAGTYETHEGEQLEWRLEAIE